MKKNVYGQSIKTRFWWILKFRKKPDKEEKYNHEDLGKEVLKPEKETTNMSLWQCFKGKSRNGKYKDADLRKQDGDKEKMDLKKQGERNWRWIVTVFLMKRNRKKESESGKETRGGGARESAELVQTKAEVNNLYEDEEVKTLAEKVL